MKPGSVIVDLAAGRGAVEARGGNCPLTEADRRWSSTACTIVG